MPVALLILINNIYSNQQLDTVSLIVYMTYITVSCLNYARNYVASDSYI